MPDFQTSILLRYHSLLQSSEPKADYNLYNMTKLDAPADAVLPRGSLVLVTGITGLIGAHVADQALQYGYRVRGVVRDLEKAHWLEDFFAAKYGQGAYEPFLAPDQGTKGALDKAMEGVSGVVHVASIMSMSTEYDEVVPPVSSFALNAIESAFNTPSVKRFVYTSSSAAALYPVPLDKQIHVTIDAFNDKAVDLARRPPPHDAMQGVWVYAASKTLAERAVLDFARERGAERPNFAVNTVLPDLILGPPLSPANQGFPTSASVLEKIFKADPSRMSLPPSHWVDVRDVARLHLAGLLGPDLKSERIFGYCGLQDDALLVDTFKKLFPDREFVHGSQTAGENRSIIDGSPRAEVLLKWLGRSGWSTLEDSLKDFGDSVLTLEKS